MRSTTVILTILCSALPLVSHAQCQCCTNTPATEIEQFELQPDAVIVKGIGQIGSIAAQAGYVIVRCKESDNVSTGQRQYAMAVAIEANRAQEIKFVDYDELDALIHGLDFISKVSYNVTTMPAFDASITTRSGLRAGAHSDQRQGTIQYFLQFNDGTAGSFTVPLTADQLSQFVTLVREAKTSLDTFRSKNGS